MLLQPVRIAITGATGWIGRNFVDLLSAEKGSGGGVKLALFASKKSEFISLSGKKWEAQKLEAGSIKGFGPDYLIHLAFKTSDYSSQMTEEKYVVENYQILNEMKIVIEESNIKKILFTSSGIQEIPNFSKKNLIYRDLKNIESSMIIDICNKKNVDFINLRIWSTTGNYLDKVSYFAFSEFILNALKSKDIYIKNKNIINRTYLDGEDIAKIGIYSLMYSNHNFIQCSDGSHIDLVQLANKIVNVLNSKSKIYYDIAENPSIEDYFPQETTLPDFLFESNLNIISLNDQIIKTANYLKNLK